MIKHLFFSPQNQCATININVSAGTKLFRPVFRYAQKACEINLAGRVRLFCLKSKIFKYKKTHSP